MVYYSQKKGSLAFVLLCLITAFLSVSCEKQDKVSLRIATTTSVEETGLLSVLTDEFTQQTGITVNTVAVGSGAALSLGRKGDVDAVFVHAPVMEKAFMQEGSGSYHVTICYSEFAIVGPATDPAEVQFAGDVLDAFRRITKQGSAFISRGDNSGTHTAELAIWNKAGIEPQKTWYFESGRGMSETLLMAAERAAYTLVDIPSWLALKSTAFFKQKYGDTYALLYRNSEELKNPYSYLIVSKQKHPHINEAAALKFKEFLISDRGTMLIKEFTIDSVSCFAVP